MILNPKSSREENLIKEFAHKMRLEYKTLTLDEYIREIENSRNQIKSGKRISMKELERGI